ncbi:MAG TPA: carbamoyltransferase C-terminal domain-containing protein [Phycisphaerales bacterium]|nr:carbamoyltransferase C-terminal domain-containing protein [Phycisphaerales bacterium]
MDPLVLGLNSLHADSSAVLMNKHGMVAAICEERINRKKHSSDFPRQAIQEVLRIAGASIRDVTDLAFARDPFANKGAKLAFIAKNPRVGFNLAKIRFDVNRERSDALHVQMGVNEADCRFNTHNVEHHLAHIASSYFCSNFEKAAAVSIDGSGDWCSVMIAKCDGKEIQILHRTHPPHSLGIFYTAMCGFIGFNKFGEEYKVMGLAAYGQPVYLEQLRKLVTWDPEKGVRMDTDVFTSYSEIQDTATRRFGNLVDGEIVMPKMWSDRLEKMFGPARGRKDPLTQRDHDIAASTQRRFEEIYMEIVRHAVEKTGCRDLVLSGGCALNGVANGRVVMEGLADRVYIHPAAGDDGTGAGAACYVLYNKLGAARGPEVSQAYWGTGYSDAEIEAAVKASGMPFKRLTREDLLKTTLDAFCSGKIVGWFQGREEWGPRALGNRSILANPNWPDMKAILNARIKNREPFRPFAPAVLEERLGDIWEGKHPVPFMNIVYKTRPEWRERLSAVNHEDNTGRVQTVRRDQNELYYDLIKAFGERTGIPVILNTSFNENEPIVHTPEQAIACFARTKMDALALGPFWYEKPADLAAKAQVIGER